MALRNEIVQLVYIILMLAETEVAPGCGAESWAEEAKRLF
jgi:hypothetical protein